MNDAGGDADASRIAASILAGDRRAGARMITRAEGGAASAASVLRLLYARGAGTPVIGITGPPGAGKSTLVDQLVASYRAAARTVAVLAVDPSSPFSGGAILGDRVRMRSHNTDAGVFIRSMAARGRLGGLARATGDALIVLDAMGFDRIIVETVGTGQSELDIIRFAQTVVVVQTPGGGDAIQAMKSGVLEIGDVFVVNKADLAGADQTIAALREAVQDRHTGTAVESWVVPVVKARAAEADVRELMAAVERHGDHLRAHVHEAVARRREQVRALLIEHAGEILRERGAAAGNASMEQLVEEIVARRCDPHSAALRWLESGLEIGV